MQALIDSMVGIWEGTGTGTYPTIDSFSYDETVTLTRLPDKPVLSYSQRTISHTGEPLHSESGFYRFEDEMVELVVAQPTGIVEAHRGRIRGNRVELRQVSIATTPSAVEVDEVRRVLEVGDGYLAYRLDLAAAGQPLTLHLEATLHPRPA